MDVYGKDVVGRDVIGTAKIDVRKHVPWHSRYDGWITLTSAADESSHGEVHVILEHFVINHYYFLRPSDLIMLFVLFCSHEHMSGIWILRQNDFSKKDIFCGKIEIWNISGLALLVVLRC